MTSVLEFFHSLLRYGVLLFVLVAGTMALLGALRKSPILVYERQITIIAVILVHIQLALGVVLYIMRFNAFSVMAPAHQRFWKYEHAATMLLAVFLVTVGRVLSKRAKSEHMKQVLIAVFYLIAFGLMMAATPWPFREVGRDLGWL